MNNHDSNLACVFQPQISPRHISKQVFRNSGDDYLYDANGNMITDRNKNIATITYNHLNLPAIVTKTTGEHVNYIYNAAGVKLSQEVYDGANTLTKKTDYLGEFFYENDTLKFINHEEGRVVMTGAEPEYQYTLKDHLGNSRVTFTSRVEEETYTATLEDNTQTEEQNTFTNYSRVTNDLLDHTDAGTVYDKVLMLNGGYNGQVGLAKSFAVVPGDTISATVYAKYITGTGSASNLSNFAAALTQAFGLTSGLPGEAATAFEALNSVGSVLATAGRDEDDDNAPKGFVNILVFDKDYNLVDFSYEQIDAAYVQDGGAKVFYPQLTAGVRIRHAGYAYVFLSNEGATEQQIGFDDYSVTHGHSAVIQQDDYYPFGLTFNSYQRENSVDQKFKFQGQEHVDDLSLAWDSFKWRNHDPAIGRFFNIDPLADKYVYNSPYAFSENQVVAHIELEALESVPYPLKQEIAKVKGAWNSFVNKVEQSVDKVVDAVTPDKQIGKTDLEKKNSTPIPVNDDQKDGGVSNTEVPSDLDGNTNPQFNPNGTPKGKGGENIVMHENGQKSVENPDKTPTNVTRDTIGVTGNVDQNGNTYNAYYVIQNNQDTIDQRGYVPDDLMPKTVVPAKSGKKKN